MPTFEVYIPAKTDADMNVTLTVDAANWLGALRTGLVNLGEDPQAITNIMCDIQSDNTIHVTDVVSGRVFRLTEMGQAAAAPADGATTQLDMPVEEEVEEWEVAETIPAPEGMIVDDQPAPAVTAPATPAAPVEPLTTVPVEPPAATPVGSSATVPIEPPALAPPPVVPAPAPWGEFDPEEPTVPASLEQRADKFKPAPEPLTRRESKPAPTDPRIGRKEQKVDVDSAIAEIFERTQDLYAEQLNPDRIVNELIDLALELIPSGAGTFYVADISAHDLQFAAVRGPKAKEILQAGIRVPMGQGIAGFCAQDGVALTIGDVQRDPRFAREISDKIGYDAQSMVCVPLQKDGRCYGAIQLINRQGTTAFAQADLDILTAVAQQAVELLSRVQT